MRKGRTALSRKDSMKNMLSDKRFPPKRIIMERIFPKRVAESK